MIQINVIKFRKLENEYNNEFNYVNLTMWIYKILSLVQHYFFLMFNTNQIEL
jgi:hypothetical protein